MVTAAKPPDVLRADAATEAPVFPRMIEMIVGIVASGVVSDPLIPFGVDVRGLRMVRLIAEGAPQIFLRRSRTAIGLGRRMCVSTVTTTGRRCRLRRSMNRSGTACENMSIANAAITATLLWLLTALLFLLTALLVAARAPLGESGKGQHQCHCKDSDACFHA